MGLFENVLDESLNLISKSSSNGLPCISQQGMGSLLFYNLTFLPALMNSMGSWSYLTDEKILKPEYDYIVVGGGSAGATVAARLSEMPCVSVLLLEAGGHEPAFLQVPSASRLFYETCLDWNYRTIPQKHSAWAHKDNKVVWNSGKVLGGGSTLNALMYVRGNKMNYDNWNITGWRYDDVKPYFLKLEDNHNINELDKGYHHVGGPVSAEKPDYNPEIKSYILKATKAMGYPQRDINGEKQIGIFDLQATTRNHERCSTNRGYLEPAKNRGNLDIRTYAFVQKILIKNNIVYGVEFEYQGKIREVRARREVIVSAGSVRTAQLLMLSGVGPKEELEKFNIPVVADLPVGKNLHDHPATTLVYSVKESITPVFRKLINPINIVKYIARRRGILTSPMITLLAFLDGLNTTAKSRDFPRHELYFVEYSVRDAKDTLNMKDEVYEKVFKPYYGKPLYMCYASILQPRSRGTIKLKSLNPHDEPLIDPNYYENEEDVLEMIEGVKICNAIANHPAMKELEAKLIDTQASNFPGCEKYVGDGYWGCLTRSITNTIWHPVGTAKMGNLDDPTTVVDPQLRVKTVENLRVVNAAIFPIIPSANTNVPTIMVAEKAADMIKEDINCRYS